MVELSVLGPIEARESGQRLALGGPQQRRLLGALLTAPSQLITLERLIEVIWSDGDPPGDARRTVMTYISRLRSVVGSELIETVGAGYRIDTSASTFDASTFVSLLDAARAVAPTKRIVLLDEALALWRGPAFGDLAGEWWARPSAMRLEELRLVASEDRVEAQLAAGQHDLAIPQLEALVAAHPLRERAVSLHMRSLDASGRRADALRAFQGWRTRLADETGLEPSTGLVALERSIACGEPPAVGVAQRRLRGYELAEVIDEGASGTVYRAIQPGLGREVAVKVIKAALADDPVFVQRFEGEAQLIARLEHPHIVPLYDFWREPGGAYLVLRLLRGGSAERSMVVDGRWSLPRVTRLIDQIGDALSAAHSNGVVHRDVKPANIVLDEAGNNYLTDFGIAATATTALDDVNEPVGSPLFAGPEQFQRAPQSPLADQYSFAATIWQLLTGVSPFPGERVSTVLRTKLNRSVPSVTTWRTDLPVHVDTVLQKATAVRPEERYPSVRDFVAAWHVATDGRIGADTGGATTVHSAAAADTMTTSPGTAANPYKGLLAFGEADSADFFGRSRLTDALAVAVEVSSFIAVVGPSGSGKSSLVLSGLLPRLRACGARIVTMVPGADPGRQLSMALLGIATRPLIGDTCGEQLCNVAAEATSQVVIVVDQFEEAWTLADEAARRPLLDALVAPAPGIRVIVTLRADQFDRPLSDPVIGALVGEHTFPVVPMSAAELAEAVTAPAHGRGVVFEPGLDSEIVAEVAGQPAVLPMLEFTLAEIFEHRDGAVITQDAYRAMGTVTGAIATRAEAVFNGLDIDQQAAVRHLFARLVATNDGAASTRRRALRSDLPAGDGPLLDLLVANRLLAVDRDPSTREPTVEVAHEALLHAWPRLRSWLDEDRELLRELHRLTTAAHGWEVTGRPASDLYRGGRLDTAGETLTGTTVALNALETEFLAASREAAEAEARQAERRRRRLHRLLAATAIALVLALVGAVVAVHQRQAATDQRGVAQLARRDAELTGLAAQSVALRSTQPDLAALLAVEAYHLSPNVHSRGALWATLTKTPGFLGYTHVGGASLDLDGISLPDGRHAIVSLEDGTLAEIDVDSGDVVSRLPRLSSNMSRASALALSADGRMLAQLNGRVTPCPPAGPCGPNSGDARPAESLGIYDLTTGRLVAGPLQPAFHAGTIAVAPDGSQVALAGGEHGEVVVYSAADGSILHHLDGLPRPDAASAVQDTAAVTYLPDGRLLVGSEAGTVRVVDQLTFGVASTFELPANSAIYGWTVSPDGTRAVATGAGAQTLVSLPTGRITWRLDGADGAACTSLAVAWAADRVYCGDPFGRLEERRLADSQPTGLRLDSQQGDLGALQISDNGNVLTSYSTSAPVISRWRLDGGGLLSHMVAPGYQTAEYVPATGQLLVLPNQPGPMAIVDPRNAAIADLEPILVGQAVNHQPIIYGLAPQADGSLLTVRYDLRTRTVEAQVPYPLPNAPYICNIDPTDRWDVCLVIRPDGAHLLRFDVTTMTDIGPDITIGDYDAKNVWIIADGSRIVVNGNPATIIYDTATGKPVGAPITGLFYATVVGNLAIGGAYDGPLGVYDLTTGKQIGTLPGSRGFTQNLATSADGTLLVAQGGDRTISLYDLTTLTRIGEPLPAAPGDLGAVALRPDGVQMATGATDPRGITIWDLDQKHWVDAACRLAGRNLTRQEWASYLQWSGPYRPTCPT